MVYHSNMSQPNPTPAAWAYLAMMRATLPNNPEPAKPVTAKPKQLKGGCLLYRLPSRTT